MLKKFIQASSWVLFSNVISKIFSFLTLSILARVLDPKGLGIYNAFITSANSINQICQSGTGIVLQRTGARLDYFGKKRVGARFGIIALIQIVFNLIASLLIYCKKEYFFQLLLNGDGKIENFNFLGIIVVFQMISQLPLALIMGFGEFKKYSLRMLLCNLILPLLLIPYIYFFPIKLSAAIYALISALLINSLLTWIILIPILRKYSIKLSAENFFYELKDIFKEGFFYYIGNTLVGAVAGIILIGLFSKHIGIVDYGYLRIAGSLIAILNIIPVALQPVTITFLASKLEHDEMILKSIQLRYITAFTFIISFLLILFIRPIIVLLFGQEYLPGTPIFIFLILSQLIILVSSLFSNFLVAKGYTIFIGISSSIGAIIYVILCLAIIPKYGINGYFIAHIVGYGIGFVLVAHKEFNTNIYVDKILFYRLTIMIILFCVTLFPLLTFNSLIINSIVTIPLLVLFIGLFFHFIMIKSEKEKLLFALNKIL